MDGVAFVSTSERRTTSSANPHVVPATHRSKGEHDEWVFTGGHGTLVLTFPAKVVGSAMETFNLTIPSPTGGHSPLQAAVSPRTRGEM